VPLVVGFSVSIIHIDLPKSVEKKYMPSIKNNNLPSHAAELDKKDILILLVDDDPFVLEVMKEYIKSFGYVCSTASDGLEAVECLKLDTYNIVITDMNMPNMNGMELLQYTRDNHPKTGVIVVTGLSEEFTFVDVIRAGAIDYLTKPFEGDELLAKLHRVIREQSLVRKLEQISIRDSLTGVYNRGHFDEKLAEELLRGTRQNYSVFLTLIDIDNFKKYNDMHGHQAGDKLLKVLGEILLNSARYGVDSAFRYGGDEFAVIITQTDLPQTRKIIERINTTYMEYDFKETTLSFGVAEFARNESLSWEEDVLNFINIADKRLYVAKNTGRGKIIYQ
jgi:diguanylate cyclase (GGDEF)-like protein